MKSHPASLTLTALTTAFSIWSSPVVRAQEPGKSADDIARELANPNTSLASLTFKNQFRSFDGDIPGADDEWSYSLLFQPSFPFDLDNGDKLIWRPALPFVAGSPTPFVAELPALSLGDIDFRGETGLGDIGFDLAYAHTTENGLLLAAGLFTTLPTATSSALGSGRWSLGPEFLIGKISEKYVLGIFPNHVWDLAGWTNNEISVTTAQVFATFLPGGGWNIGTSPIMTYNWNTEQWNIPLNLTVGKTVTLGGKPWKLALEANYYIERNDLFATEWMIGFNVTPVIKNPLAKLFGK